MAPVSASSTVGAPPEQEARRQPAEGGAAWIGPARAPLDDGRAGCSQRPVEVSCDEAQHPQVPLTEVLRVEEPFAARVRDVEALELVGSTPVVVPHRQGGLVEEAVAGL